jgi:predicted N-acyltransferase
MGWMPWVFCGGTWITVWRKLGELVAVEAVRIYQHSSGIFGPDGRPADICCTTDLRFLPLSFSFCSSNFFIPIRSPRLALASRVLHPSVPSSITSRNDWLVETKGQL